jgi:SET domain-containing protein
MGSGCAPYYNTCKEGEANTKMIRFFDEDRFEIYATRDIKAGEELLHTYISLKWRTCFQELNDIVHAGSEDSEHKSDS